jgi:hypothetical protein
VAEPTARRLLLLPRLSLMILGNLAIYCKRPEAPERKDSSRRNLRKCEINRTLTFVFCILQAFPQDRVAQA